MSKLLELDSERKTAVLNAALREFTSSGYKNASTNRIAREAGISKALMFHYVGSKKELFLTVYDFFTDLLQRQYYDLMDFGEKDIFRKLRQSYSLQIRLLQKYPCILEYKKLLSCESPEINGEFESRKQNHNIGCYPGLFDSIDESKFREGLNAEKCKQLIYWSNVGLVNQLLGDLDGDRTARSGEMILDEIDGYFSELRKAFYKEN